MKIEITRIDPILLDATTASKEPEYVKAGKCEVRFRVNTLDKGFELRGKLDVLGTLDELEDDRPTLIRIIKENIRTYVQ